MVKHAIRLTENIAILAETALRFLEIVQLSQGAGGGESGVKEEVSQVKVRIFALPNCFF